MHSSNAPSSRTFLPSLPHNIYSTPPNTQTLYNILPLPPCSVVLTYWQHGGELQIELAGVHGPHYRRGPGGDDATRHQSLEISVAEGGEEREEEVGGEERKGERRGGEDELRFKQLSPNASCREWVLLHCHPVQSSEMKMAVQVQAGQQSEDCYFLT